MLAELSPSTALPFDVDGTLADRVERTVRCRTGGRIRDLRVQLFGEDVVLSGVTSTYYAKQLATHAALDELGGGQLTNSIEVQ